MAKIELGQSFSAIIDRAVTNVTRTSKAQYLSDKEKVATLHRRKGGEEIGIWIQGIPVVGHSRDIVHTYENGKLNNRFILGDPPHEVEILSTEETQYWLDPTGGMEN
jgi:hypothetical protein